MNHPWKDIDLQDYEHHMRLDSVHQLQTLNEIMKEQFYTYPVKTVMILGIAGGNGLEHIDPCRFDKVYGVDINKDYLAASVERYPELLTMYEPICCDLSDTIVCLPAAQLLIANLLIEYIGYHHFQNIIRRVNPRYVSCIIQVNADANFVSDSPYTAVFDRLNEIYYSVDESALTEAMNQIGYHKTERNGHSLPNGKKLLRMDFCVLPVAHSEK